MMEKNIAIANKNLKCIVHVNNETDPEDSNIKPLSQTAFRKLKEVAKARQKFKSSKYRELIKYFPLEYDSSFGYHSICYKNFTALPASTKISTKDLLYCKEPMPQNCFEPLKSTSQSDTLEQAIESQIMTQSLQGSEKHQQQTNTKERTDETTFDTSDHKLTELINEEQRQNTNKKENTDQVIGMVCEYCKKSVITQNYKKQKLIKGSKQFADNLSPNNSSFIFYHSICRIREFKKGESLTFQNNESKNSSWHQRRKIHKKAFDDLCVYMTSMVFQKSQPISLKNLHRDYINQLKILDPECCNEEEFHPHHLENKVLKYFGDKIQLEKLRHDTIIYKTGICMSEPIKARFEALRNASNPVELIKKCAYTLRESILELNPMPLTDRSNVESLLTADSDPPELVKVFVQHLCKGPQYDTSELSARMKSLASDIIFNASNSKIVPAKHLALGLGFKSLTGKKDILQILNKFGHSINYWLAEEIETNLAEQIAAKKSSLPDGLKPESHLTTCLAFDNYDEEVETLNGKGTLHETVGICFQINSTYTQDESQSSFNEKPLDLTKSAVKNKTNKKRRLDYEEPTLYPYVKKLRLESQKWSCQPSTNVPQSYNEANLRDILWVFTHHEIKNRIPMWIGYNSITVKDNNPVQKVAYLKNYQEHSTDPAMVLETLKITKNVAKECSQTYGIVTYDLAIAKPAMQIQSLERPEFDNIFVHFGSFHLFLSFFSALGKVIAASGIEQILIESGVLATNSCKSLISGRHYNRCKRIHTLFALAISLQHINFFLETCQDVGYMTPEGFTDFLQGRFIDNDGSLDIPEEYEVFLLKYLKFCEETRSGKHGCTAQFWFFYIDTVFLYLKMSRAVRMNDVDLFTYCLPKLTNLFFITNHQNYARWMVKYYENLSTMEDKYPGLKSILKKGGLSVKRSNIPFSGTPIDQTLEQTVNRDAANKCGGIKAMTNEKAAHLRWTQTRSIRSEIVEKLKDMAFMTSAEVCKETENSRIKRDNQDLESLRSVISMSSNPFKPDLNKDTLYNIGTGKAANEETKDFLTNIAEKGEFLRKTFIEECQADPERFNKAIKKQAINNFEKETIKVKVPSKELKSKEINLTCALFGRICSIAVAHKISISCLLQYSLTPVPLMLSHIDNSFQKTEKSALLRHIEKLYSLSSIEEKPELIEYEIIDAMFYLHILPPDIPETFGTLSIFILKRICASNAKTIDVVFDRYFTKSIKNLERIRRSEVNDSDYIIQGPHQKRPKDFISALGNQRFKKSFSLFLANDWIKERHEKIIGDKIIRVTLESKCFVISKTISKQDIELNCEHEEADSRIVFHLENFCKSKSVSDISIRTGDTDVAIIVLGNIEKSEIIKETRSIIWLDFGSGKNRRYINISRIYNKMGPNLCLSLPGFHTFTGTDHTAAFARKGKIRPFNVLKNNPIYQQAFSQLGSNCKPENKTIDTLEAFTCEMYGLKNEKSVNAARVQIFQNWTTPKGNLFSSTKVIDPSLLPPCASVLQQKINRCNYICKIWSNACRAYPLKKNESPLENGWTEKENTYFPLWDSKSSCPENLDDILEKLGESEVDESNDSDSD